MNRIIEQNKTDNRRDHVLISSSDSKETTRTDPIEFLRDWHAEGPFNPVSWINSFLDESLVISPTHETDSVGTDRIHPPPLTSITTPQVSVFSSSPLSSSPQDGLSGERDVPPSTTATSSLMTDRPTTDIDTCLSAEKHRGSATSQPSLESVLNSLTVSLQLREEELSDTVGSCIHQLHLSIPSVYADIATVRTLSTKCTDNLSYLMKDLCSVDSTQKSSLQFLSEIDLTKTRLDRCRRLLIDVSRWEPIVKQTEGLLAHLMMRSVLSAPHHLSQSSISHPPSHGHTLSFPYDILSSSSQMLVIQQLLLSFSSFSSSSHSAGGSSDSSPTTASASSSSTFIPHTLPTTATSSPPPQAAGAASTETTDLATAETTAAAAVAGAGGILTLSDSPVAEVWINICVLRDTGRVLSTVGDDSSRGKVVDGLEHRFIALCRSVLEVAILVGVQHRWIPLIRSATTAATSAAAAAVTAEQAVTSSAGGSTGQGRLGDSSDMCRRREERGAYNRVSIVGEKKGWGSSGWSSNSLIVQEALEVYILLHRDKDVADIVLQVLSKAANWIWNKLWERTQAGGAERTALPVMETVSRRGGAGGEDGNVGEDIGMLLGEGGG
eukprot:GHVQ01002327.1.p2 GENE.GHVQ01002327.1~~GHVQ01002327.1.p2  ORF type:complete len:609 (-),score=139.13 GHVQ01002327.1:3658-5484(-)